MAEFLTRTPGFKKELVDTGEIQLFQRVIGVCSQGVEGVEREEQPCVPWVSTPSPGAPWGLGSLNLAFPIALFWRFQRSWLAAPYGDFALTDERLLQRVY